MHELYERYQAIKDELACCQRCLEQCQESQDWFSDVYQQQERVKRLTETLYGVYQQQVPLNRLDTLYVLYTQVVETLKQRITVLNQHLYSCENTINQFEQLKYKGGEYESR